jgi:hypothetical protein
VSKLNWNKWHEIYIPTLPKTGNCRYCKHTEWEHRPNEKGLRPCTEGSNLCKAVPFESRSIIIPNDYQSDICPCMNYVPGDNLAFLEWKSKRGY